MKDSRVRIHFNHEEINVDSNLKITPENLYTRCINVLSQYILDVLVSFVNERINMYVHSRKEAQTFKGVSSYMYR